MRMSHAAEIALKPRLKQILVDRLKLDRAPGSISDAEPLFGSEGLGLDSIDALEIVLELQRSFGVEIADELVGKRVLGSVRTIVEFIESSRGGAR